MIAILALAVLIIGAVTVTLDEGITFYSLGKDNSKPSSFNAAPAGIVAAAIGDAADLSQRQATAPGPITVSWFVLFPGAVPAAQTTNLEFCSGDPTDPNQWFIADSYSGVANNTQRVVVNNLPKFARCRTTVLTTPGGGLVAGFYCG